MSTFAKIENGLIVNTVVCNSDEFKNKLKNYIEIPADEKTGSPVAGIGYEYNEEKSVFIPPKKYDSWILDDKLMTYVAPVEKPTDAIENEKDSFWNELEKGWNEITFAKNEKDEIIFTKTNRITKADGVKIIDAEIIPDDEIKK